MYLLEKKKNLFCNLDLFQAISLSYCCLILLKISVPFLSLFWYFWSLYQKRNHFSGSYIIEMYWKFIENGSFFFIKAQNEKKILYQKIFYFLLPVYDKGNIVFASVFQNWVFTIFPHFECVCLYFCYLQNIFKNNLHTEFGGQNKNWCSELRSYLKLFENIGFNLHTEPPKAIQIHCCP